MSFRTRLTLFFIVIVIVPMVAVAVVLFRLVADSERGQSDARLGQAQTAGSRLFEESQRNAAEAGRQVVEAPRLAAAIQSGDRRDIQTELDVLAERTRAVRAILTLDGRGRFAYGSGPVVGAATTALLDRQGKEVGRLRTSVTPAQRFAQQIFQFTGLQAVVLEGGETVAVTETLRGVDGTDLPTRGATEVRGLEYRVTSFDGPGFEPSKRTVVRLLGDERSTRSAITKDSLVVAALLVAFLLFAFAFALTVSRSLQAQVQRLLEAAKRLGGGEWSIEVPTEGNDEFAALGSEFNAMARTLEARVEELKTERERLQHAVRRVGESFAKGLDREALIGIVVKTAVDGAGAEAGRASVRNPGEGRSRERARAGDVELHAKALDAAEAAVLDAGEASEISLEGSSAMAYPLRPSEEEGEVLGLISVARAGQPFTAAEKELFHYLAEQAAVSIENVDLHETVQRQAVTDELTGLFNHRRFQEVMTAEVERAKRFGSALGLVMLDIDDFKRINDRHGHLQGDIVLREVANVLRDASREIDEPARYGGEELAVALPQTDLEGAHQFAERVRRRIERLDIPSLNGDGSPLKVTASFGVAALPESAQPDKGALVAAADSALYEAKRAGKNRVIRAG